MRLTPYEAQAQNVDMAEYQRQVEEEQRADYVAGLLREKAGVEQRGADYPKRLMRIDAIDVELRRMGHEAAAPAKHAETREAKQPAAARRRGAS
jgi:hypothetical protein